LLPRDFFFSITKSPPKIVVELLHKAQKYLNIKDAIVEKEMTSKGKRDEGTSHHPEKMKETRSVRQTSDTKKNFLDQRSRFTNFTPLIMPIE